MNNIKVVMENWKSHKNCEEWKIVDNVLKKMSLKCLCV